MFDVSSTTPWADDTLVPAERSASVLTNSRQRSRSVIAEPPWVTEHAQLGDVPPEEQRHRPVGDDAELPRDERQLVEVVGARHEPAEEAAEREPEDERDSLVTAECGHLSERLVGVGLHV